MSLNWAMLTPDRSPVPLPDELTITAVTSNVEVSLNIPDAPPTGSSSSGGSGGAKKLKETGALYLTDKRLIFIAPPSRSFDSLSIPLPAILSTRFEQPTFGANYLGFEIKRPTAVLQTDKAMFEFVSLLEKTREKAIYMKRHGAEEEEGLPTYTYPAESSTVSYVGDVPVDNPPSYDA
ncbi:hypothetical protein BDN71DRAFT_1487426 [Pleurotus eryngii]|uniref:GRAM domain-containing protein n=1 Tax=Pleurotus eryngii TaxID=5323 RepID=A0A9P6DJ04_PLEER|nr:hypothetical protein BDN71DRAFT_1487426 [Pleurotus eryngii]